MIHGDHDLRIPYAPGTAAYANASPPKFLLTLLGAPHTPMLPPWEPTMDAVLVDFLDGYVKGDRRAVAAALARDGNVPGVATIQTTL